MVVVGLTVGRLAPRSHRFSIRKWDSHHEGAFVNEGLKNQVGPRMKMKVGKQFVTRSC